MATISDLENTLAALRHDGLILHPTDTVWSISCDATNPVAVERLFRLKQDRDPKQFELLVGSLNMLRRYVQHLHPKLETLLYYHVRPLTVLFEGIRHLPDRLLSADGTLGIRLAQDDYCRELIRSYGYPLYVTPANSPGASYPNGLGSVRSDILQGVDYIAKQQDHPSASRELPVVVKLSEQDELLFLRE